MYFVIVFVPSETATWAQTVLIDWVSASVRLTSP